MKIVHYRTSVGRDPISKWYENLDGSVKPTVDKALEKLLKQDFSPDATLMAGIKHLTHSSENNKYQGINLYEIHATHKLRIYFSIIGDKIVLLHANEKDHHHAQYNDIMEALNRYIEIAPKKSTSATQTFRM